MSQFKINSITDRSGYCGPVISGVSTNNSTGCMIIPAGPTSYRGNRGRGIFAHGYEPNSVRNIDVINVATTGNAFPVVATLITSIFLTELGSYP